MSSGQSGRSVALELGGYPSLVHQLAMRSGGVALQLVKSHGYRFLSLVEHEEISRGGLTGLSCRMVATESSRAPSTIPLEIKHERSVDSYRARIMLTEQALSDHVCLKPPNFQVAQHCALLLKPSWNKDGSLCRESHGALTIGRTLRYRKGPHAYAGQGHIPTMELITQRLAEVDDRATPGNWKDDLVLGNEAATETTVDFFVNTFLKALLSIHKEQDLMP